MSSQIACQNTCIVALVAFARLFSGVNFQMWSNCLPEQMHSCTGFPCMICFRSEISNVSSNFLLEQMQSRIGYIRMIFLKSGFSKMFSNCLHEQIHSHIGCI